VLTLIEAAERLGLSPITLRIQIRNGKLRAKKVGRDWTVSEREVARYARENRRPTLAPGWTLRR
jgi:excisionase family DNA binding protein